MAESCIERMQRIDSKRKIADFMAKEKQDYTFKKKYARIRAEEFARECDSRGLNYHVSVGGLDSITLYLFLKSIGINAPGITVSSLEDKSIQRVHKALGLERLKPSVKYVDDNGKEHRWTKPQILQEYGFPVLSKETANKIETLANPTERNKTNARKHRAGNIRSNRTGQKRKIADYKSTKNRLFNVWVRNTFGKKTT